MKRLILLLFVVSSFLSGKAQTDSTASLSNDSIAIRTCNLIDELLVLKLMEHQSNRYKIYPTENIFILIKLDTYTGKLELIQWSLNPDDEFTATLNDVDLSLNGGLNSFELYPTKNMYQFILLDKATGRNWHVQWGTKSSELWIRRIF